MFHMDLGCASNFFARKDRRSATVPGLSVPESPLTSCFLFLCCGTAVHRSLTSKIIVRASAEVVVDSFILLEYCRANDIKDGY